MDHKSKLLQLQDYFLSNYGYMTFISPDVIGADEVWLMKVDNDNKYDLIRISFSNADNYQFDLVKYDEKFQAASFLKDNKQLVVLNIFINHDKYDPALINGEYINMDIDYYDGIDVSSYFPTIKNVLHNAENQKKEDKEIEKRIKKNHTKKLNALFGLKDSNFLDVYIIIGICILVYILEYIISRNYSDSAAYIALGGLYKTFVVGLKQYYRLITYAFLHGGIVHLICNMYSFYILGRQVNLLYGTKSTLFILFTSILIGGFTQTLLLGNTLAVGLSAGIYGLFLVYIIALFNRKAINLNTFIPVIVINIALNFLSTTAWVAHIGGLIGGLISYLIITKEGKEKTGFIILYVVLIAALFVKLYLTKTVDPIYAGTDLEVVQFFKDIGLNSYANSLLQKLMNFYSQIGG